MREHEGIINIESRLVKSMDEEGNSRVASPDEPKPLPLLLVHNNDFREY
jgi:hypothetical protein